MRPPRGRVGLIVLALLVTLLAPFGDHVWIRELKESPPVVRPLSAVFRPPEGFARVEAEPTTFQAFLRNLPIRQDRTHVLAYDGRRLARPSAAVVLLDVGERDLQQCADSAIRLHAEWLWDAGHSNRAAYHFTSGDLTRFRDWVQGERISVKGSKVTRSKGTPRGGRHPSYRRWLDLVFRYAGTRSLRLDSDTVGDAPVLGGDFYVQPGSPGHAVVVLDVAQHRDGRRVALLGQGFIPAEDFHVLRATHDRVLDGVWFLLPDAAHPTLSTPSWRPFRAGEARRFRQ